MTLEMLREFFLWCTILNVGLLFVSSLMIMIAKGFMYRIHGKLFNLPEAKIASSVYKWLGFYKALIIVFNLAPYLALVIIEKY